MENERYKEKIRRVAGGSAVVLTVYLLLPIGICGRNFLAGFADGYSSGESVDGTVFLELIILIGVAVAAVAAVANSLKLLLGMRKGDSPFHAENGKRIRRTGVMLMLIEPLLLLSKLVSGGEVSGIYGISFAAGLIMYNVSLLFDYGAHLQKESDETL